MDVPPKTVYAAQPVEDARDSAYSTFQIVVPIPSCKNGRKKFPFGKQLTIYLSTEINYNEYDDPMSVSVKTVFGPCQILEVMPVYMHVPYQTGIIVDMPKEGSGLPSDPTINPDFLTKPPLTPTENGAPVKKGEYNYAFLPLSLEPDQELLCDPIQGRRQPHLTHAQPPRPYGHQNENVLNTTICSGGPRCQNVPHQVGDQQACIMRRRALEKAESPATSTSSTEGHPANGSPDSESLSAPTPPNSKRRRTSGPVDSSPRGDGEFGKGDGFMARGEMKHRAPQFQKTLAFYRKKISHSYMDALLKNKNVDAVVGRGPTHVTCRLCDTRLLFKGSSMVQHVYKHCNADLFKCSSCNFASHFSCVVIQHSRLIHPSADPFYFHDLRNHHDSKLAQLVVDCYADASP